MRNGGNVVFQASFNHLSVGVLRAVVNQITPIFKCFFFSIKFSFDSFIPFTRTFHPFILLFFSTRPTHIFFWPRTLTSTQEPHQFSYDSTCILFAPLSSFQLFSLYHLQPHSLHTYFFPPPLPPFFCLSLYRPPFSLEPSSFRMLLEGGGV